MRNFKLLLATTAILSTGLTMETHAWDTVTVASQTLNAGVNFVEPLEIEINDQLFFGLVSNPVAGQTVVIDANGGETTGTATRIDNLTFRPKINVTGPLDGYSPAIDTQNGDLTLMLPEDITLKNSDGYVCGHVTEMTVSDDFSLDPINSSYGYIGGKLTIGAKEGETFSGASGNCTGYGTITLAVY